MSGIGKCPFDECKESLAPAPTFEFRRRKGGSLLAAAMWQARQRRDEQNSLLEEKASASPKQLF